MEYSAEVMDSVRYLGSDKALQALEADPYWPKWDSPWWHMLLLHEMGETKRIPERTIRKYISSLNGISIKIFPIHLGEIPEGVDPYRGPLCHCQVGNIHQVLAVWGVDVDKELPWIRPWFLRYQMVDGGLNCDNEAYLVKNECPSSMVGTIAAFEAILLHTSRPWTDEEKTFLNNAAKFLIERKLMRGSQTNHNAAERVSAEQWMKLCFPRFYLYDILRGLNALLHWAEKTKQPLPPDAVRDVVTHLAERFHDGVVRNERHCYDGVRTILPSPSGEWLRRQPATFFPLLTRVSKIGEVSPYLSKQWADVKNKLSSYPELRVKI